MKVKILVLSVFVFFLLFTASGVTAQTTSRNVRGSVLNGKAANLVKPDYPAAARAVKAGGAVNIQVTIDKEGNVIEATAVSGHPLLRRASETAAKASKFLPTCLEGQPLEVTGIVVYNFASGQSDTPRSATVPEQAATTDGFKAEILNGKAEKLPAPDYPPAARAVAAGGKVNVQVTVDESGNVIDAKIVSGHLLLRASSLAAAKEAKFAATLIDGKAVKVTGVIIYNFDTPPAGQ